MYSTLYVPRNTQVGMFPALHKDTQLLPLGGVEKAVASSLHHCPALHVEVRVGVELTTTLLNHVCHILDGMIDTCVIDCIQHDRTSRVKTTICKTMKETLKVSKIN